MAEIICPLCGKPNPPDLEECMYCQAPLKTGGFIAPPEGEDEFTKLMSASQKAREAESKPAEGESTSSLEESIPDWLKATEASFLDQTETPPPEEKPAELPPDQISEQVDSLINPLPSPAEGRESAIDDEWLQSLLSDAGMDESAQSAALAEPPEEQTTQESQEKAEDITGEPGEEEELPPAIPAEKPDWLTSLEAASTIKLAGGMSQAEVQPTVPFTEEPSQESDQGEVTPPDWLAKAIPAEEAPSSPAEPEPAISPAELPSWLEALRPMDVTEPTEATGPVEDVSSADIVTAGPLVGLRGVISPQSAAIRARKPPTYSIKLRVTDEQRARVEMMEALLADEEKPKPLPAPRAISSRNIFRLVIVIALLLPILWMVISGSRNTALPQSGNFPGLIDFTQAIQMLPNGAPVLIAFDYEAGFSGEMNLAIGSVISQLMHKNSYLALVATTSSGPALGESAIRNVYMKQMGNSTNYPYYANLGYITGGTMGLRGLATSPQSTVPYTLNDIDVWAVVPLSEISTIGDFSAVLVLTNDADTARNWIEQVGPFLREANRPLLFVSSSQAEPLILPYYEAYPSQVQGLVSGLAGGVAYARSIGTIQENGVWDAFSIGITVSALVIIIGSIASGVVKTLPSGTKKEN